MGTEHPFNPIVKISDNFKVTKDHDRPEYSYDHISFLFNPTLAMAAQNPTSKEKNQKTHRRHGPYMYDKRGAMNRHRNQHPNSPGRNVYGNSINMNHRRVMPGIFFPGEMPYAPPVLPPGSQPMPIPHPGMAYPMAYNNPYQQMQYIQQQQQQMYHAQLYSSMASSLSSNYSQSPTSMSPMSNANYIYMAEQNSKPPPKKQEISGSPKSKSPK